MPFNVCWIFKLLCDLSCRTKPVQSVVHLWGQNFPNENEQTNSGIGVLLMIFHHKHHTTFSELALRSHRNKVKCDKNYHLESPFQINANQCKTINKQQNLKIFFYWIIYEMLVVKFHIRFEVCNEEEWLRTTSYLAEESEMTLLPNQYIDNWFLGPKLMKTKSFIWLDVSAMSKTFDWTVLFIL